ncbi:MAG TPA: hypothetical protein VMR79_01530 [Verrucomicrobiae bacterium]|nr:hypothetical protein [Verrucomicrobiae bacterium]
MRQALDLRQLRALLGAYFRMNLRGKAVRAFYRRKPSKLGGATAMVLLYAAMGTVAGFGATGSHDPFSFALVMHSITFVMLGMSLAAESGDLLFNLPEHDVLAHLPLGPRTMLLAKAASLMGFALLLGLALNLPPMLLGLRVTGMRATFPLVHLATVVLLVAFTTSTIVFTYGLVGRFVDRNRFGSVAAWSQAGLSAAFLGFSQVLAHLLELPRFRLDAAYALVYPPAWFAALDVLGAAAPPPRALPLSLLAVAATLGLGWMAVARLAPGYAGALAQLGETPTRRARPSPGAERAPGGLLGWWLRDPAERAAFQLTAVYLRRDRETKTRLYPSLGFFLLLPVAQLFSRATYSLTAGAFVSVLILGMLPSVILEALRTSSHHAATEVFAAVPLGSAAPLFHGARKAAMYYVILPGTVIALFWIAATDAAKLPVAVPSLLALPFLSLLPAAGRDYVPLSEPPTTGRQSTANVVIGMLITLVGAMVLAVAWAAQRAGVLPHLIALQAVVMLAACRLLGAHIRRRPLRREA